MARIGRFGTDIPTEAHRKWPIQGDAHRNPELEGRARTEPALDLAHTGLNHPDAPTQRRLRDMSAEPRPPDLCAKERCDPPGLPEPGDLGLAALGPTHIADSVTNRASPAISCGSEQDGHGVCLIRGVAKPGGASRRPMQARLPAK